MTRLTDLQADVLTTLLAENTRLRWHSYQTPMKVGDTGKGQVVGIDSQFKVASIPAYVVRSLIRRELVAPATHIERQPFKRGVTHRDYIITDAGRRALGGTR